MRDPVPDYNYVLVPLVCANSTIDCVGYKQQKVISHHSGCREVHKVLAESVSGEGPLPSS